MENLIGDILKQNGKHVLIGEVEKIVRISNSDHYYCVFTSLSGRSKYFMKFDKYTKEIITFHKNVRACNRDTRKNIKLEFWKKWNPCLFNSTIPEDKIKLEFMQDLTAVVKGRNRKLKELDLVTLTGLPRGDFEKET